MITGVIVKILNQKSNDWGRYKLDCMGKELLAVGVIPNASLGMSVTLEGYEEDTKWGHQFKVTSVLSSQADSASGARTFLSDGYVKGIGPTKANAIIAAFGNKSVKMFETEDGRKLLTTIKGITPALLEKALPSYQENKKYLDIIMFLNGSGTKLQVENIFEQYGEQSAKILKKNPYRLQLDLDGFGFLKTDALALSSGIKADSPYRIMAGVKYIIETAASTEGHCYLEVETIKKKIADLLAPMPKINDGDITDKIIENAVDDWSAKRESFIAKHNPTSDTLQKIEQTLETRNIILNGFAEAVSQAITEGTLINDDGKIYTAKMYQMEENIASSIIDMIKSKPVRFVSKDIVDIAIKEVEDHKTKVMEKEKGYKSEFSMTSEQKRATFLGVMNRVSIISGGPGRGKTTILETVAEAFLAAGRQRDKRDVIMLAPTGRAAQRMTEATGYPSMTAHRAVAEFKHSGELPNGKLVIVDESSMVDIYLMNDIMKYVKNCNVIFVGDVDQIASVGPGKILKDLIESKEIPCILLKEGHRNSGNIAHNADLINAGVKIDKYAYGNDFLYFPAREKSDLKKIIIDDYKKKVKEYGIENVMLCTAMRKRGEIAVDKLNLELQEEFTAGNKQVTYGEKKFRIGDRVMQTKNDYNFLMRRPDGVRYGAFNGERGNVTNIIYDPDTESYNLVVTFDDGSVGGYTKDTAVNLTLAYVTTIHKCQGSEALCMMMAYTFGDYLLLNRSLFYTGETRAKKEFRFYGEEQWKWGNLQSAFDVAVSRIDDTKRNTGLSLKIKEKAKEY